MMYWDDGSGYSWFLMLPMMILIWGLIIAAIIYIVRGSNNNKTTPERNHDNGERILSERFAKGDIDEEEYKKRITVLKEHNSK